MEAAGFVLELVGVASFAISGTMVAIEKKADAFGVLLLAIITALGGGVLRDLLLGCLPPRMFTSFPYLTVAVFFSLLVFVDAIARHDQYHVRKELLDRVNNFFDALGLAAFTVSGMDLTILQCGLDNPLLPVVMGVITGVGGGMIRDTLLNTMPRVLYKRVYAVASLLGALLYYVLLRLGAADIPAALAAMALIVLLRFLATKYRWNLPHAEP